MNLLINPKKIFANDFENINAIESIMPFMERRGVAETSQNQKIVSLKAVDERLFKSFYDLNFRGSELKHNQIFIGEDLSHRLEKDIGGKITIYSPLDQSIGFGIPYKKEFIIAGIFKYDFADCGGPIQTLSSANLTCIDSLSAVECTATVAISSSLQARITRTAISPLFAISIFLIIYSTRIKS